MGEPIRSRIGGEELPFGEFTNARFFAGSKTGKRKRSVGRSIKTTTIIIPVILSSLLIQISVVILENP
jgi:hypothetical protein